jgi:hypothetical protein
MTTKQGVDAILEVEEETGLFVAVCWSKEDIEERFDITMSDEEWYRSKRLVNNHCTFSAEVASALHFAFNELEK